MDSKGFIKEQKYIDTEEDCATFADILPYIEPVPFTPGMRVRRVKIKKACHDWGCPVGSWETVKECLAIGIFESATGFLFDVSDFISVVEQEVVDEEIKDRWQPNTHPDHIGKDTLHNAPDDLSYIPGQACIVRGSKPMGMYGAKVWQGVTESERKHKEHVEAERKQYERL